jgi:hypothetical protein
MRPNRASLAAVAAAVTAVVVIVVGVVFTLARDRDYQSFATVVLSPDGSDPERVSSLLESFERSGTLGTYVELMASDDTTSEARGLGVDVTVRSVPDTRTIRLTGVGEQQDVQPALRSVIATTQSKQATLADLFALGVLEQPSEPEQSGPADGLLLAATALLAGFAALAVLLILRQLERPAPPSGRSRSADRGKPDRERRRPTASA